MITIHKADDRGTTELGWLESSHSFSFGDFFDPEKMGFRTLRVLNDDHVQPGKGFPTHGHRDMEIVSYVLKGALQHKDDAGNEGVISHGEVQKMSAGTGIRHSEWNHSETEPVHFLQIWIIPRTQGVTPSYEHAPFDLDEAKQNWVLLAAQAGGLVTVDQDIAMAATIVQSGQRRALEFDEGRAGYMFVAKGAVRFHGNELHAGDAAQIEDEASLEIEALFDSEVIVFDIA